MYGLGVACPSNPAIEAGTNACDAAFLAAQNAAHPKTYQEGLLTWVNAPLAALYAIAEIPTSAESRNILFGTGFGLGILTPLIGLAAWFAFKGGRR